MFKRKLLFTMVAAGLAAACISVGTAFAAEPASSPEYPSDFIRTLDLSEKGLTDYAISGNKCALASNTFVYVLTSSTDSDGCVLEQTNVGTEVTALAYFEGNLYYKIASGNAYQYPAVSDNSQPIDAETSSDIFPSPISRAETAAGDMYNLNKDTTELKVFSSSGVETPVGEGYTCLKDFKGDGIYAVKDNCPQKLDGATSTPISMKYMDFKAAEEVGTGNIAAKLKDSAYSVRTATLKASSAEKNRYYTRINGEKIGATFETVGQNHTLKTTTKTCLVLAEEGNLAVIVMDGNCYITASDNLEEMGYTPSNDWPQGADGTRKAYLREKTGVYASPYMCASTLVTTAAESGAIEVTVKEKFAPEFFGADYVFYRIEYKDDAGETVTGFVAKGYLDEYDYSADADRPTPSDTSDFSYGTNVTTVILVLVVVGLVIIAVAYLTIVGTKPDKKKRQKADKAQQDEVEEDDGAEGEEQ